MLISLRFIRTSQAGRSAYEETMEHDKRIQKILGENRGRNQQNSSRYLDYLT